jgi:hypothetical protein
MFRSRIYEDVDREPTLWGSFSSKLMSEINNLTARLKKATNYDPLVPGMMVEFMVHTC